jgi:hypothetical protein
MSDEIRLSLRAAELWDRYIISLEHFSFEMIEECDETLKSLLSEYDLPLYIRAFAHHYFANSETDNTFFHAIKGAQVCLLMKAIAPYDKGIRVFLFRAYQDLGKVLRATDADTGIYHGPRGPSSASPMAMDSDTGESGSSEASDTSPMATDFGNDEINTNNYSGDALLATDVDGGVPLDHHAYSSSSSMASDSSDSIEYSSTASTATPLAQDTDGGVPFDPSGADADTSSSSSTAHESDVDPAFEAQQLYYSSMYEGPALPEPSVIYKTSGIPRHPNDLSAAMSIPWLAKAAQSPIEEAMLAFSRMTNEVEKYQQDDARQLANRISQEFDSYNLVYHANREAHYLNADMSATLNRMGEQGGAVPPNRVRPIFDFMTIVREVGKFIEIYNLVCS